MKIYLSDISVPKIIHTFLVFICLSAGYAYADKGVDAFHNINNQNIINIRSTDGKLYAYIVLLFNENPHFVNLIQEDSISSEMLQTEGFHIREYDNYLKSIKIPEIKKTAETMLNIYYYPKRCDDKYLESTAEKLTKNNIILRFSRDRNLGKERIVLDYCIFGIKKPLDITHPLFNISTKEKIYNIQPLIYYDEFSTSNSTFYFDMIYINPEEVNNDYIIARKVLAGENVYSMFFVGASVNNDIKYCIAHAFDNKAAIKNEIFRMFEIHELTHKILNNHYDYFDQVSGEELALSSTIFSNPYLGLSVMYSYLEYNPINPHRIAAMNYVRFIANKTGKLELVDDPSSLKILPVIEIKKYTKEHFEAILKNLK
ncbi:MAG: hypothetical protein MUC95_06165 [Spirochaetes bacterium]|nr:hypothetical protein [Spirochaetota bacterium]